MTNRPVLILLACSLFLGGCGGKVPLSGRVTFSDDGTPLTTGMVCFENDAFLARGPLGPDGTYVIGSAKKDDGLPPGTYRVSVSDAFQVEGYDSDGNDIRHSRIEPRFSDGATSGLTFEVPASGRIFDFQVERKK